jgi:S-formylglutathione hydrolase FrmB
MISFARVRSLQVVLWSSVAAASVFAAPQDGATTRPEPVVAAFGVSYPAAAFAGPFTGRVVVYFADADRGPLRREPRFGPDWFRPAPLFGASIVDLPPDRPFLWSAAEGVVFPALPERPAKRAYWAQAVLDRNLGGRAIGDSAGNLYSKPQRVDFDPAAKLLLEFSCDQVVAAAPFVETDRVKELRAPSAVLSKFYGRPTTVNAAVVLPASYGLEPGRRYPTYFSVPGFGGTHRGWSGAALDGGGRRRDPTSRAGEEFLHVELDPSCPGGHSVFADSANNGPWGEALIREFLPAFEAEFRARAEAGARFVGGHSSGGWSSLWLQVAYPETFGGCWSTAPDPVDFRDFQGIDLYAPQRNLFLDDTGGERPLARSGGQVLIRFRRFSDMERPLRGEQLGSFEQVFSPRLPNGAARPLWNRETGAIDAETAAAWRPYDLGLKLRTEWPRLRPVLAGKIHVYMGTEDTFYLDGAARLLKRDLEALGAEAVVELFPGDHGSVMTQALRRRIDEEIAATYRRNHGPAETRGK